MQPGKVSIGRMKVRAVRLRLESSITEADFGTGDIANPTDALRRPPARKPHCQDRKTSKSQQVRSRMANPQLTPPEAHLAVGSLENITANEVQKLKAADILVLK